LSGSLRSAVATVVLLLAAFAVVGQARGQNAAALHTDPLNLDPVVRQGYERFDNLDFEAALKIFNGVAAAHAQEPMAWDYVLVVTLFRDLYQWDLLDTTYYAHDNFLSNKREIPITAAERNNVETLVNRVITLANGRLNANPNDKNALFARGYAKGLHAVFITLVDHSYASAARQGYQAKEDSQAALKIDPAYADANMAVGIQQFAVASLPRFVRMVVGIMGVGGNKQRGLELLRASGAHGVVTPVESRTILSLFLRHDGRYPEALEVQRGLATQFPHNYLFQLEVANLLKDEGQGLQAIAQYKVVLADAAKPGYFVDPRLQLALFGLADTQRGYNDIHGAAANFEAAAMQPGCSDWLKKRALVNAGEMYDLLHDRGQAVKMYQMALAGGGDQSQADAARKYLRAPFTGK
jgi:tetratricopeptide (TPR) repeat protein